MHLTAFSNCQAFFDKYINPVFQQNKQVMTIADLGAFNVNGTVKPIFDGHRYIGIDMEAGPNVDMVCSNSKIPLDDKSCDVVVSTSCLEHDECFWMTFIEMCRLVKPGGYIYINAPSAGPYHTHPVDCWRFYADSWAALAKWARSHDHNIELVEHYIDQACQWKNSVGIFCMH